jgi:hypothetical protein
MPGDEAPHKLANHLSSRFILFAARINKCLPKRAFDANTQA